ncbi:MAG: DNA mismatch repair protein MutH, partial [Dehalococcoidia bacterium]
MQLIEALPILQRACNIKFNHLFKDLPIDLKTNKGSVGQLLELHIGLSLGSELTDFSDGELKTNKSDPSG